MRTVGIYCSSVLFTLAVATFAAPPDSDPWAPKVQPLPGPVTLAEFTGEWYKRHMSTVDFVNPSTGAHAAPSGECFNIHFYPDGTYKSGWLLQSSLFNCSTRVFGYKTGVYKQVGRFHYQTGRENLFVEEQRHVSRTMEL